MLKLNDPKIVDEHFLPMQPISLEPPPARELKPFDLMAYGSADRLRTVASEEFKRMAYGPSDMAVQPNLYRLERGVRFLRAGVPIVTIPQFKAQTIATVLSSSAINQVTNAASVPQQAAGSFVTTSTIVNVAWPQRVA